MFIIKYIRKRRFQPRELANLDARRSPRKLHSFRGRRGATVRARARGSCAIEHPRVYLFNRDYCVARRVANWNQMTRDALSLRPFVLDGVDGTEREPCYKMSENDPLSGKSNRTVASILIASIQDSRHESSISEGESRNFRVFPPER